MFGGAYDHAPPEERPVYGALNHTGSAVGGSPRFGSCHLVLAASVRERVTMCYPDSSLEPAALGTADACDLISTLLADTVEDPLDDYVEAQVHGPVLVSRDAAAVVLDPSYRGTSVEAAAQTLGCAVSWHRGFSMVVEEVIDRHAATVAGYRGPHVLAVAQAVAAGGVLTPPVIGQAARQGDHDPQDLKRVWHLLARFGRT